MGGLANWLLIEELYFGMWLMLCLFSNIAAFADAQSSNIIVEILPRLNQID